MKDVEHLHAAVDHLAGVPIGRLLRRVDDITAGKTWGSLLTICYNSRIQGSHFVRMPPVDAAEATVHKLGDTAAGERDVSGGEGVWCVRVRE